MEGIHHVAAFARHIHGDSLRGLIAVHHCFDGLGNAHRVVGAAVAGDGDGSALILADDGLGRHHHLHVRHHVQRNGTARGRGDQHGTQRIQTLARVGLTPDHHIDLLAVYLEDRGGGAGELAAHGGADGGGGKPVLRGHVPPQRHIHLRHLIPGAGFQIHRVGYAVGNLL
ncbi:hypothetical protein SDC9_97085 [bioreactor metagenome]|uniref:Uncharacterized protein n=1 Tax=bioreactor metagenome TaxID=1076179 RepID=A0A645ABP5_9ZZZZ